MSPEVEEAHEEEGEEEDEEIVQDEYDDDEKEDGRERLTRVSCSHADPVNLT